MKEVASRFKGITPLVRDPDVFQKIVFDSQYKNAAVGDPRRHGLIIMPFMPRGEKIASVNKPNRTCPLLMVADVRMGDCWNNRKSDSVLVVWANQHLHLLQQRKVKVRLVQLTIRAQLVRLRIRTTTMTFP